MREYSACFLDLQPAAVGWELDSFLCIDVGHDLLHARTGGAENYCCIIKRRALGCYALYRTYNGIRYNQFNSGEVRDAFARYLREGARGTALSAELFD